MSPFVTEESLRSMSLGHETSTEERGPSEESGRSFTVNCPKKTTNKTLIVLFRTTNYPFLLAAVGDLLWQNSPCILEKGRASLQEGILASTINHSYSYYSSSGYETIIVPVYLLFLDQM